MLQHCDRLEEEGTLSSDISSDVEDLKEQWAGVCQFLDDRFVEIRRTQVELSKRPAPKPTREPKTDAEKVQLEQMCYGNSCLRHHDPQLTPRSL